MAKYSHSKGRLLHFDIKVFGPTKSFLNKKYIIARYTYGTSIKIPTGKKDDRKNQLALFC